MVVIGSAAPVADMTATAEPGSDFGTDALENDADAAA
jgi:hypothetical protein